jgi:outer membrane biosynthesis protein TonB
MTERHYGIVGTCIVHSIVVLLLIFTYITLSIPTPSEGGILINFGDVENAGGLFEPALNNAADNGADAAPAVPPETKDGLMTQDFEEAPAVKKPDEAIKTEKKPEQKAVVKPLQTPVKEPAKPVVNTKALYSNKGTKGASTTESGTSEGIYKGSGNQGDPTGTPESDNYSKGLGGGGMVANLNGRNPLHLQKPEFNILKEGIVVVEITVDRSGKVISATPGFKGSTLVDNTLYAAAKKAALESKFNLKSDAPERQVGTITYHFKLQ